MISGVIRHNGTPVIALQVFRSQRESSVEGM
jgi:hypothetical protein